MTTEHDKQATINAASVHLLRWIGGLYELSASASSVEEAILLAGSCPVAAHRLSEIERLRSRLYGFGLNFKASVLPAAIRIIESETDDKAVIEKIRVTLSRAISAYSAACAASLKDEQRITNIAELLIQTQSEISDYSFEDETEAYNFARSFVTNARHKATTPVNYENLDEELNALVC